MTNQYKFVKSHKRTILTSYGSKIHICFPDMVFCINDYGFFAFLISNDKINVMNNYHSSIAGKICLGYFNFEQDINKAISLFYNSAWINFDHRDNLPLFLNLYCNYENADLLIGIKKYIPLKAGKFVDSLIMRYYGHGYVATN